MDSSLQVENVIWSTGFLPGLEWVDLPIFGVDGAPLHDRGIVTSEPGLYFVGLHFQYSHDVGPDQWCGAGCEMGGQRRLRSGGR